jgi:UDP-N-acetylmuramyl pentapeptide phosphotransferase/UDP-N-acetylglucosamine-1-phosphate transferase
MLRIIQKQNKELIIVKVAGKYSYHSALRVNTIGVLAIISVLSAYANNWTDLNIVQVHCIPATLIAFSSTKLNSRQARASPCYRPFVISTNKCHCIFTWHLVLLIVSCTNVVNFLDVCNRSIAS